MEQELEVYCQHIVDDYLKGRDLNDPVQQKMAENFNIKVLPGRKYIKIIEVDTKGESRRVHSFIVKEDGPKFKKGDILMAATYAAPATNFARGNIMNPNGECMSLRWHNVRWSGVS